MEEKVFMQWTNNKYLLSSTTDKLVYRKLMFFQQLP